MGGIVRPVAVQIKRLDFLSCPGCPAQELEAGGDAWVAGEAFDVDAAAQFIKTVFFFETGKQEFQRYPMEWVPACFRHVGRYPLCW